MTDEEFDLWWEFRLAFSDLPHVRIYLRDGTDRRRGPAYASGRFLPPPGPSHLVFVYDERMWGDVDVRLHEQPPFPAYLDSETNAVMNWFGSCFSEWAQESRDRWNEEHGVFNRGMHHRPWKPGDPRSAEDVFFSSGQQAIFGGWRGL